MEKQINLHEAYLSFGYTADEIENFEKLMNLCETGDRANITLAFQIGFLGEKPNQMFVDNFWNVLGVFNRDNSFSSSKKGMLFDGWVYDALNNKRISDISDYFEYIDCFDITLHKPKNAIVPMDTRVFMCMSNDVDYVLKVNRGLFQYFLKSNDNVFEYLVMPSNAKIHLDLTHSDFVSNEFLKKLLSKMGAESSMSVRITDKRNNLDLSDTSIKHVYCKEVNLNECVELFIDLFLPNDLVDFCLDMTLDKSKPYFLPDVKSFMSKVHSSLLSCDKLEKISYNIFGVIDSKHKTHGYNLPDRCFTSIKHVEETTVEWLHKVLADFFAFIKITT